MRRRRSLAVLALIALVGGCAPAEPTPTPGPVGSAAAGPARTIDPGAPAVPETPVGSSERIEAAELAGGLDHDTAMLYQVQAALDAASLPSAYRDDAGVAPEATGFLADLVGRLESLPPAIRTAVMPYLLRPTDLASTWALRPTALSGAVRLAVATAPIAYDHVDAARTAVRVWYATPLGGSERALAERLAAEIDASDMWAKERVAMLGRTPCSDEEQADPRNGGSAALDVYLVYPSTGLDWHGRTTSLAGQSDTASMGVTVPAEAGTQCEWIAYIALNAALGFDDLRATMAHELFHAFQFAFRRSATADRLWWMEATATWAEDLVYPALDTEQPYLTGSWSNALGVDGPLDSTSGTDEYAAYLWPFFLRQRAGGDATVVGQVWAASETKPPLEVIGADAAWKGAFKTFATWNWNEAPLVEYVDHGGPIAEGVLSQRAQCMEDDCALTVGRHDLAVNLPHASVQYADGVPDVGVEQITFTLADLRSRPGAGIGAILWVGPPGSAGETVRVEDWSSLDERTLCLAREDVRRIVLVLTNSAVTDSAVLQGQIGIEGSVDPCGGSVASWVTKSHAHVEATNACPGDLETTDVDSRLSMSVTTTKGGTGIATVSYTFHRVIVTLVGPCGGSGDTSVTTKTEDTTGAGTAEASTTWRIGEDGSIGYEAYWDASIPAVETRSIACSPGCPAPEVTTTDTVLQWDALAFDATAALPLGPVVSGSQTEMSSDGSETTVISWTLER